MLCVFTTHTQIKEVECLEGKEVSKTANTSWTKKKQKLPRHGTVDAHSRGGYMALGGTAARAALRVGAKLRWLTVNR